MRQPADVVLDRHQAEPGVPLEHAAEDHLRERLLNAEIRQHVLNGHEVRRTGERRGGAEMKESGSRASAAPTKGFVSGIEIRAIIGAASQTSPPRRPSGRALELGDAAPDVVKRHHRDPGESTGCDGAILGEPIVVGREARRLELRVADAKELETEARIENLGDDTVVVLIAEASDGIVSSTRTRS